MNALGGQPPINTQLLMCCFARLTTSCKVDPALNSPFMVDPGIRSVTLPVDCAEEGVVAVEVVGGT